MKRVLITAPADPVVSLSECKTMLSIAGSGQDNVLPMAIAAAAGTLDPASGGWLGRALRPQTWELRLSGFPCEGIKLPFPPLIGVVSVKYDDANGVERVLTADTDYRVFGVGSDEASIKPAFGGSWPTSRCDEESVRIRFDAGHPVAGTDPVAPDKMPVPIQYAVALGVRILMSNAGENLYLSNRTVDGIGSRSYVVSDAANSAIKTAVEGLLVPYRVFE